MSPRFAGNTKRALMDAAVHLTARGGPESVTIQSIARHVGITEGAIYRHFRSKDELRWEAYRRIVSEMIHEKERLTSQSIPVRAKLRQWIELTYDYFDHTHEAFAYVFLTPHPEPLSDEDRTLTRQQGQLFMSMVEEATLCGELRLLPAETILCLFTGLMLNVPRSIDAGTLPGPAGLYVNEIADAVWRVLRPDGEDSFSAGER